MFTFGNDVLTTFKMGLRRVEKYRKVLAAIPSLNRLQLKGIVKNGSNDFISCLCELVDNILRGKIPLTVSQKRKLNRYKLTLRKLGCKSVPLTVKKRIFANSQSGGFLPFLIPPLLGIAGTLAGRAIAKGIGI